MLKIKNVCLWRRCTGSLLSIAIRIYELWVSSIAVDFVKTGHRPPPLTKDLQPDTYPHFMERNDKKLHQSDSILGQLYNVIKKTKLNVNQYNNSNKKPFPYASLIIDGYLSYTEEARILKDEYDRECMYD